jgi:fructuronate reductase
VIARLHPSRLASLPPGVARPAYDPASHGVGIVHLGLGAFHRAHQAVYLDRVLATEGGDWRVIGVSCRSPLPRDHLKPQECLYLVRERDVARERYQLIGSIADALVAPENPAAVIKLMSSRAIRIISLTITEKGYCRSAADGGLDLRHHDIVHDLEHLSHPRSAPGLLLAALRERQRTGTAPPTLLSCDNLPQNGATLRAVLMQLASVQEPALAEWIERHVAFPSTMVDRIVPATTPEDRQQAAAALGVLDEALVCTEPFTQWVIEDRFATERPQLERVGAQLVADVHPFELAKLRLLNGSHSTMAYLGSLLGHTYVHEAIADELLGALIRRMMGSELAPTLTPVAGLDLSAYQQALLARFANPALAHRLQQIAMDGSQKLPQRLLRPLQQRLERGESAVLLTLAVAAWIYYALGRAATEAPRVVDDPLAAKYRDISEWAGTDASAIVAGFLKLSEVFTPELAAHARLHRMLAEHLQALFTSGARATMRTVWSGLSQ